MGSLCRCLFLHCCNTRDDNDRDDDNDDEHNDTNDRTNNNQRGQQQQQQQSYSSVSDYVHHSSMEGRGLISGWGDQRQQQRTSNDGLPTNLSSQTIVTVNDVDVDYDNDREQNNTNNNHNNCCRPSGTATTNSETSLYDRIRRQLNRFHNSNNNNNAYNVINGRDDEILHQYYTNVGNNNSNNKKKSVQPLPHPSPLRQAISFNTTTNSEIPCTINNDEIVLPGSLLQQQMADEMRKLSTSSGSSNNKVLYSRSGSYTIEECVICMEPFDSSNPRMPTLCNCGVNKTYFHLPCLYQWTEQCAECPSCRTKLTWEEF